MLAARIVVGGGWFGEACELAGGRGLATEFAEQVAASPIDRLDQGVSTQQNPIASELAGFSAEFNGSIAAIKPLVAAISMATPSGTTSWLLCNSNSILDGIACIGLRDEVPRSEIVLRRPSG